MCLFKRKRKSNFVVKERTQDISPYVIPHISSKGSYNENPYEEFVSPTLGREEKKDLTPSKEHISNKSIDRYKAFMEKPEYTEDEPYSEFQMVNKKPKVQKPIVEEVKEDIEETTTEEVQEETIVETKENNYSTFEYQANELEPNRDATYYKDLFGFEDEEKEVVKPKVQETRASSYAQETVKEDYEEKEFTTLDDEHEMEGYTIEDLQLLRSCHKSPSYQNYQNPTLDILDEPVDQESEDADWIQSQVDSINSTLEAYKVQGVVAEHTSGPTFTRYAIKLAPGVSGNRVENLSVDLQRALSAMSLRIQNPIPGKPYVGVEVPNRIRRTVALKELLTREEYLNPKKPLIFPVGLDVEGKAKYISVTDLPHGLVAGASGSGKSVFLNTLVTSLILKNSPEELRFFFIDPKQVDLQAYAKIPHLLSPIVTEPQKGIESLKWMINEMERRFSLFRLIGVANIKDYKKARVEQPELPNIPYIVMIIDEAGDFLMNGGAEAMMLVTKLIQKCRASGIHMFLSTQKPVAKIISTSIKSNASARFALSVASVQDSLVILDEGGAENLLGNGDMIFAHPEGGGRFQSAYVSNAEVRRITQAVQRQAPLDFYFNPEEVERKNQGRSQGFKDELFADVARYVVSENRCSSNQIGKVFQMGFNRTGEIIKALEEAGIVGENGGTKPREVLVTYDELEEILKSL